MSNEAEVESELGQPHQPAAKEAIAQPPVVLRACGLKRWFGKVPAVDGLDLTVRKGEIYGFLGVNGAGKTTTIRMLMGIIKPEAGTIELLGQETRRTTIRQKQSIGYVSQEQTFYPWMTCRALGRFVGGFYPTWDEDEFFRLLRVLDVPVDRKASQLSSGMRVKLALALALAPRPGLLILDEPTSGLDPVARREFLQIIQRQARDHQRTTFFSSHIIGEVERVADRVGIIHRGQMRYDGTLGALRDSVRQVRVPAPAKMPVNTVTPLLSGVSLAAPEANMPEPAEGVIVAEVEAEPETMPISTPAQEAPPVPPISSVDSTPSPAPSPAFVPPPGFEVLRDETREGERSLVLKAPPAAWETFQYPEAQVSPLSIEDIFIALVGTITTAL